MELPSEKRWGRMGRVGKVEGYVYVLDLGSLVGCLDSGPARYHTIPEVVEVKRTKSK